MPAKEENTNKSIPQSEQEAAVNSPPSSAVENQNRRDEEGGAAGGHQYRSLFIALEIIIIIAWAMFVGRDYLNLDPTVWPNGREFGMAVQTHFIWTQLADCGICMLWNGSINGGSPAFAELHGAVLHPLVIIPTIILGVVNGVKIGLIAALAMAGLGSWWLARAMKLGVVARLWAAMMAVAGGHLAGRMDMGVVAVVFSTAAASLVIAAGVDLALDGRRRSAVLLGITLALVIVSGQGYLQIGLLFGVIPAFVILLFDDQYHLTNLWREFLIAAGLGLLLAAVFLVPVLHFFPNFGKEIDAAFGGAQTPGNTLLNLVISDISVYFKGALGTFPYPYQYVIFIGWIPVILAILALRLVPKQGTRLLTFFITAVILVSLTASAVTLGWLANINDELASLVRIPSLAAGLLVPLVLALAAWSADLLLRRDWPLTISLPTRSANNDETPRQATIHLSWLVVGLLVIISLYTSYTFSKAWLHTIVIDTALENVVDEAVNLTAGEPQWIHFPFGEHFWAPNALDQGLKITGVVRPWHWRDREPPAPYLVISTAAASGNDPGYQGTVERLGFVLDNDQPYAYVQTGSGRMPCIAKTRGGNIDVTCDNRSSGTLIVQENQVSGWSVERDGRQAALEPAPWLSTEAPAGSHEYSFRYRPWDVPIGLILTLIGIALCIWIWFFRAEKE